MKRYLRQTQLKNFGIGKQQKLSDAKVLVIGAGGLGCPVLTYLATAGVGTLGIVDFDIVEESNLARQPLYMQEDIGRKKAEVAAEKLKQLNPELWAIPYTEKFDIGNALKFVENFDLIIDGSDNFTTRYLLNDACVQAGKAFISGSIEGWQGQISLFNADENCPTYRCLYPEPPNPEDAPNCSDIGVVATLPGVIGTIMANEAIKYLTNSGSTLSGKLLLLDLLNNSFKTLNIHRNEAEVLKAKQRNLHQAEEKLSTISYAEARELIEKGKAVLVDIRDEYEFEEENAGGINIPYHELLNNIEQLPEGEKIILVCEKGLKSAILAKHLREKHHLQQVLSLEGGLRQLLPPSE